VTNFGRVPELFNGLRSDVISGSDDWHGHTRQGVDWHVYIGDACKVLPILEQYLRQLRKAEGGLRAMNSA